MRQVKLQKCSKTPEWTRERKQMHPTDAFDCSKMPNPASLSVSNQKTKKKVYSSPDCFLRSKQGAPVSPASESPPGYTNSNHRGGRFLSGADGDSCESGHHAGKVGGLRSTAKTTRGIFDGCIFKSKLRAALKWEIRIYQ